MQQRADDRERHAADAGNHAASRGGRIAHPLEREDEQRGRDEIDQLNQRVDHLAGSRFLNIFSMRSVMRNPLTMFVVDAKTATAPRMVLSRDSCSPASRMAPTTAIAEI